MIAKPAKTPIISPPDRIQHRRTPSGSLKLRILVKSDHISPKLVNIIFLAPGGSGWKET